MAENNGVSFEIKRQIVAIKAIRDMEVDNLLTGLRLIRSYLNEEQLQTPVLKFLQENLPNVTVVGNNENEQLDLRWKDEDGNNNNMRQYLGRFQNSIGMPECFQTPGGVETQRLSIGMISKSCRLPKRGEMLVSVNGSPLGVYEEGNMEAIHELEDS